MQLNTHHTEATKLRISQKLRNRSKGCTHKERIAQSLKEYWARKKKVR